MDIKSDIPVIKGHFLFGSLKEVRNDFLEFMIRLFRDHGGLAKFYMGKKPVYVISEPELIEQVMIKQKDTFVKPYEFDKPRGLALVLGRGLITNKGPSWQRQQRMIKPVFSRSSIAQMGSLVASLGDRMVSTILAECKGGDIDMAARMSEVTLEIISQTMFSNGAGRLQQRLATDLEVLLSYAQGNFFHPFPLPPGIPVKKNRQFNEAKRFLTNAIVDMIEERKISSEQYDDLLSVLLAAEDVSSGEKMSAQQIVDESLTIFSAGHETTATALTWALYLVAIHRDVRDKLEDEVDKVLLGRTPDMDDIDKLPYTRAVLDEVMRLYPPIVALLRRVDADAEINGYRLEKGAHTLVNIFNLHHHPDYWEEPDQFKPERFLAENKASIKRHTYIPFGIGHRVCIGNHFALMEGVILLTQMVQRLRFELSEEQEVKPWLAVSLRPRGGLKMRVTPRTLNTVKNNVIGQSPPHNRCEQTELLMDE